MLDLNLSDIAELTKIPPPKVIVRTHKVAIRRPDPSEWFTVRPDDLDPPQKWTARIPIHTPARIGTQKIGQPYIVTDAEALKVLQEKKSVRICDVYLLQNRDDTTAYLSVIPVFQPTYTGQEENDFNKTRRICYEDGKSGWVQMANQGDGSYGSSVPTITFSPPNWPKHLPTLKSYLDIAFEGHVIDSREHTIIQRMEGKL